MKKEASHDRRIAGIKAKRLEEMGELSVSTKQILETVSMILIISPWHNRIATLLSMILARGGKRIKITGVELYRHALERLETDLQNRVITLIITDRPEDYNVTSTNKLPMWKEAILSYQRDYAETYAKEIEEEAFPPNLTVITMFKSHRGRMPDDEIDQLVKEFETFQKESQINQIHCENEEELKTEVDRNVVELVLARQRIRDKIKKYTRTRDEKLRRAKHVTKSAFYKQALKKIEKPAG